MTFQHCYKEHFVPAQLWQKCQGRRLWSLTPNFIMILLLKGLIWFGISNFQEFLKEVRFLVSIKVSLTLKKEKSISKGQNNRKELESFIILCLIIWLLKLFHIKNESVMKDFFTFLVFYIFPDKRTEIRTRNGRHL